MFPVNSSAILYTLSWSSLLTFEFKTVSCTIITRVKMERAQIKLRGFMRKNRQASPVFGSPQLYLK